jgi:hypothetical protein
MKRLLLPCILLASVAALAQTAEAPADVNGKWKIHSVISGNENDVTCTFVQKDANLTGSCESEQGKTDLAGTVNGKKIKWTYKSEYNGTPLTVNYEGSLESPKKITGSTSVVEFGVEGEFTATPAN